MEQIARALQLKSELDILRPIDKEREAIIMQKFRLDWDYHSNHLEGNSLTYGETKALILFGITAQGKPLKDHVEITGHDEAIKWIIEVVKDEYPLTESFIRQLHELLLKEPYEVDAITLDGQPTKKRIEPGKYKTVPNHVKTKTGEIFRFATPEETPALMHDLMEWYRQKKEEAEMNPILLAAEFHYRFIRIHPFDDGNGRMARILMNFIFMQFGYPPVIIKTSDKGNYFSVLQLADSGTIEPFIDYIAGNLIRSLEIMIAGAKGESIEEPDDLDKEIALLEQKLKAVGKKVEVTRTKETVLNVYDNSITRLWEIFINSCEKFNRFYKSSGFEILIDKQHVKIEADRHAILLSGRKLIDEKTDHINLIYFYDSFNYVGFKGFEHLSWIRIDFNWDQFVIGTSKKDKIIEKTYGEQLTDEELYEIVQFEMERHKNLITEKLKEVQTKKNE